MDSEFLKNRKKIIDKIIKLNPNTKPEDYGWRLDGRLEWFCEDGVGHTVYAPDGYFIHGCNGKCKAVKRIDSKKENKLDTEHPGSRFMI